jgi:hypothetical protein
VFAVEAMTFANPIAQYAHMSRDCIYEEAEVSLSMKKYQGEPIAEQVASYYSDGHPEHWGLWGGMVIARKHTRKVKAFGRAWQQENDIWSFQDQISEPFVLRNFGMVPASFPIRSSDPWLYQVFSERHVRSF